MSTDVYDRMRDDWNQRAREDANYYVAFGRRDQGDDEFFDSGAEMVTSFENELRRLPERTNPAGRNALEIGCGPGRLMRPLSRHFSEIHGVDISDEMIALAREKLRYIPHAHPHYTPSSDLAEFADSSLDFVYSYAVFQHIPDRELVFGYFRDTKRILKDNGIARFQINGLPETVVRYDTWSGVRIAASEVAEFARENDFQLLALEGVATQYMWTTWRKRPPGWTDRLAPAKQDSARLCRITNTYSSEPVAPTRGRFASVSFWLEKLPEDCDLNHLEITIGGEYAFATYIGPPEHDGLRQLNAYLPQGLTTGLQTVEIRWMGVRLCAPASLRVTPPGPSVPRVAEVTDGINLLSGRKIVSGTVKVVLEEVEDPHRLNITLGGREIKELDSFCTDPRVPVYEINFNVPKDIPPGPRELNLTLGRRRFAPVELELA